MELLNEENIVKHLSLVEQRLYRSSDREGQLRLISKARYMQIWGIILTKAVELGHPLDRLVDGVK